MGTSQFINSVKKYALDLSLWLNDYDDIYSDIDSRNYLKCRVSTDFPDELRRALKNKNEEIHDLVLLLHAEKRDKEKEEKIEQSLITFFGRQLLASKKKYNKNLKKGISFFIIAISLMVINAVISSRLHSNLLSSFIRIVLEPSEWLLIWISFDVFHNDLKESTDAYNI